MIARIERYKRPSPLPRFMKKSGFVIVFIIALLVLGGCQKKNVLTGRAIDVSQGATSKDSSSEGSQVNTEDDESSVTNEPRDPEQFADITEVPTYDLKSQCTKDSKGVVRFFDDAGKKTVYRNECVAGLLVTYDCEANQITSKNTPCDGVCKQGAYGDSCE